LFDLLIQVYFSFNEKVAPACIWDPIVKIQSLEAAGYGSIDFGDKRSDKLLKIGLKLVNATECNKNFKADDSLKNGINEGQICAQGKMTKQGESDTCSGDSGGPLQINHKIIKNDRKYHVPVLLGLTSFGIGCASGTPGVYMNTTAYMDFIDRTVNNL
jgi:secreted trypsin-like serine protease